MMSPMGVIPAMMHTASLDTVRYALATLKHIILYVLSNRFRFLFVLSAFDQIGPPYLSMDSATLASSLRLLAITAELLDIILESAAIAVDALYRHIQRG